MAVTLKRKRGAVSYREPSSDEEISESSGQEGQVRPKRATPSRRSTRRSEPAAQQMGPVADRRRATGSREGRRREVPKISYKDVSTDEEEQDDPDDDFEADNDEPPRRTKPPTTSARSPKPHKPSKSKGKSPQKLVLGAPRRDNVTSPVATTTAPIPTDGHIPAWASLPYHVLLQVFVYASHPLRDENMKPMASIPWLVQMARTCSAFTKPALTALYRNPPVFAMKQTRRDLVHHLISLPADAHEDYRVMVKRLELDATQLSALTDHAHSVGDLAALVSSLTTLREIDIFDPIDRPPFRDRLRRLRRWVYPPELFEALRQSALRLRSWRWNSTFCDHGPLWMKTVHSDASFQTLREVTLTKFHPAELRDDQEDAQGQPTTEELVASALVALPHLQTLAFESCGIVSGRLLPLLPANLVSLSITNCGELLSDALQAFLTTHGSQLEDLTLNHNQSLDLSFLVDLKTSCPKLEVLRMDTTYYSSLSMSSDNEPLYETLLGETERPTWPTTLRILDMEYLRNWNSTAATNFFSSLIDAADELPWLREITIIAMVDTDWRQRAEFRIKWTEQFRKVFARAYISPNPHLVSLKAYRERTANVHVPETEKEMEKNDSLVEGVPVGLDGAKHDESDSDVPLLQSRKQKQDEQWGSKRLRSRSKAATSYDESSNEESSEDEATAEDEVLFVQGRCHTVLFRIDNFRPREEIYGEADFLDAEPSGDEEWNGNDDQDDEGGYAW
ncbi:hypothetical protein HBH43_042410 [Parastagonospora nodorum]|nr:hypothetical protein HBH43_042410 [Parastagonospora nodorum]KAH4861391.1 hypothetical protein HBH75_029820 [Parastagonospora nodorum]KAH5242736.1 hypothetical protein HBI72_195280 [Parastagonospora nodorum]